MSDVEASPPQNAEKPGKPDPSMRRAALWAAVIAVPVAIAVGLLIVWQVIPSGDTTPEAKASASAAPVPSTPVEMAAPKLTARAAQACLAVTSQLPMKVRGLPARKVSSGPEQNAAYGEPPITVSCGVPQPTLCERVDGGHAGCVPLDATMLKMNGVCWYGVPGKATDEFTTMDREIAVRVNVPSSYNQTAQWANEFSDTVVKTVLSKTAGVPTGCTQ